MKIYTKSGSVYDIDGRWKKINRHGQYVDSGSLWALKQSKEPLDKLDWPWKNEDAWQDVTDLKDIEVGRHLYISGKDSWWVTTEIVKVEK